LIVRPASADDLPCMMALEKRAATAAHWTVAQYEALFGVAGAERIALVILGDDTQPGDENEQTENVECIGLKGPSIRGFIVGRAEGVEWEIENIAIVGPARRRGLGTRLLGQFLDLARARGAESVFLEVRESNHAARLLYEKWSFTESGRRKGYYAGPKEDAILYRITFV